MTLLTVMNSQFSQRNYNNINTLFKASQNNINDLHNWITLTLSIAGLILTIITIFLGFLAFLTWRHWDQAKKVDDLLEDINKKRKIIEEAPPFILQSAQSKGSSKEKGLSKIDLEKRSESRRGFGPFLFQAVGEPEVYALDDDFRQLHHIPNPPTLEKMGYSWADVQKVTRDQIAGINKGEPIPDLSTQKKL